MAGVAFRLRQLPPAARAGLSLLLLTVLGGLVASATHLVRQHQGRDERPGLSLDDLRGAFHGVRTTAPLRAVLARQHPPGLPAADRDALLRWLDGGRLSEDYDNVDLGAAAPADVIERSCLQCHARGAKAGDGIGARVPLDYWDDVRLLAFARDVSPLAVDIVVASTHTHALGMGTLSLVLCGLAFCTRWRRLPAALTLPCGLGLLVDLGAWLPAREFPWLVPTMAVAGTLWFAATALLCLLVLAELWWPAPPPTTLPAMATTPATPKSSATPKTSTTP